LKKMSILLVVAAPLALLAGCKSEKPPEVVQTVEWYKANRTERTEVLAKCKSNPGELAATPNCINATRADTSTTWSARGGGIAPVKPLTADDINKK
jgi:hypothetical protein